MVRPIKAVQGITRSIQRQNRGYTPVEARSLSCDGKTGIELAPTV